MPYFWDMTPGTLPRPDLNPLANPALERNLSRWAEVYFGNPPEKRDQAVNLLLQEIKNETSEILAAERSRRESSAKSREVKAPEISPSAPRWTETRPSEIKAPAGQDVSCPQCGHRNPPDHQFCGQCGGGLNPAQSGATVRAALADNEAVGSHPADIAPATETDGEVQWLRDRSLGHLYEAEAPPWGGWKYVLAGVVIALGGLAYFQWDMTHPAKTGSSVSAPASRISAPVSPLASQASQATTQPTVEASASVPSSSSKKSTHALVTDEPAPKSSGTQITPEVKAEPAGIQPAAQKSSLLSTPLAPRTIDDSANGDLKLAQRYLGGSMGTRDASEAAKLLWRAVGKQNPTAAILLSGLYARGDGVPKSCDQARLLLLAATKHGSAQAAQQLRDMEQRGCR